MAGELVLFLSVKDVQTGLWCNDCLLPSGLRITFGISCRHGGIPTSSMVQLVCTDCGNHNVEPDP